MSHFAATIRDIPNAAVLAFGILSGGFTYYLATDADLPVPVIVPPVLECTPLQLQLALLSLGFLDNFYAFAQTEKVAGRRTLLLTLDHASKILSTNPIFASTIASLGLPVATLNNIFNLAVTL